MSNTYTIKTEQSAKEKSFLGLEGACVVRDYFVECAGVPDITQWRLIVDGGASVAMAVEGTINTGCSRIQAGVVAGEDGVMDTYNLKTFCLNQVDVSEIKFKAYIKITDLTGEFGFGFAEQHATRTAESYNFAVADLACIYGDNDVIYAQTSDGAVVERTDISAEFADGVAILIEIIETATQVIFYANGAIIATHITNVSGPKVKMAGFAARNTNAQDPDIKVIMCEAW